MRKRAYIIHGWEGSSESNWFPWLKTELQKSGVKAEALAMPDSYHPTMSAWVESIASAVGKADDNVYLVGHSLGVIAILRYLESFPENSKIGGAVLVAGFPESIGARELDTFFATALDYGKVRSAAGSFVAIHSDDDPYVPMRNGELLRDGIGAELIVFNNAGHLNANDGYTELPIVLEKLKEMTK